MTVHDAAYRASAHDHVTSDCLSMCPRCADLLEVGAKWCNGCGVWVMLDAPPSSELRSRAMHAELELEAAEAARERGA